MELFLILGGGWVLALGCIGVTMVLLVQAITLITHKGASKE